MSKPPCFVAVGGRAPETWQAAARSYSQHVLPRPAIPPTASLFITLALLAYTIGVWSERLAGRLRPWHLAAFVCGLVFDTLGTGLMFQYVGGMTFDVHGITGLLAIILMAVHAVWAAVVLWRRDEVALVRFHRLSVFVWCVWLVPFLSPMFFGQPRV